MADPTPATPGAADGPGDGLFRVIVETSPYLYAVLDEQVRFRYVSAASREILGYEPAELIGRNAAEIIHEEDFDLALGALAQLVDEYDAHPDEGIPMAVRLIRKDGSLTHVEIGAVPRHDDPDVGGVIVRGRPMSGQQLLDQALEALVASSPLDDVLDYLVTSIDHELRGVYAAIGYGWDGATFASVVSHHLGPELCGATAGEAGDVDLDTPWAMALARREQAVYASPDELPSGVRAAARAAGLSACWVVPVPVPPDNALLACITVWRDVPGPPFVSHLVALDRASRLTSLAFERRHTEELLRHAALHDTLTGIANRSQFFLRLDALAAPTRPIDPIDRSDRAGPVEPTAPAVGPGASAPGPPEPGEGDGLVAVLYCDLDGFKQVNDTHGHGAGDALLRAGTDRISASVRPQDLVARLGGDEFAVLCTGLHDVSEATAIADRLIEAMRPPIDLDGSIIGITVSIGVALGRPGTQDGRALLEAADAALYEAKRAGRDQWRLAPPSPD